MSFYQYHRPQSFDAIYGNIATVEALQKLVSKKNRPHVYLFSGPYGTGKTTCARIFASSVGCQDLHEMNMSETRGIDAIRDIIDTSKYVSLNGGVSVWILDEAHGLTGEAANAVLKLLEDCPDHAYFILCTTEPQKINGGIKSRCSQFSFGPLKAIETKKLIRYVATKEKVELEPETLIDLIEASDGYPRRALVLLESVASIEGEENRRKYIKEVREDVDIQSPEFIEVVRMVVNGSRQTWRKIAGNLSAMQKNKVDPEGLRRGILTYMSKVLLSNSGAQAEKISDRMQELKEPTYNTGFAGLINQVFRALHME